MGQVSSIITIAKYHPSYKKKHSRKRLSVFLLYFFLAIPTCWSKTRAIVRGTQRRGRNILCHFSNFNNSNSILECSKAGTLNLAVGWELKLVVSANLYIVREVSPNHTTLTDWLKKTLAEMLTNSYIVRKLQVNDRPVGSKKNVHLFWGVSPSPCLHFLFWFDKLYFNFHLIW